MLLLDGESQSKASTKDNVAVQPVEFELAAGTGLMSEGIDCDALNDANDPDDDFEYTMDTGEDDDIEIRDGNHGQEDHDDAQHKEANVTCCVLVQRQE